MKTTLLNKFNIFVKSIFTKKNNVEVDVNAVKTVTFGERDKDGFASVYINGVKTKCRVLLFTEEQIKKFDDIKPNYSSKPDVEKLKKINEIYKNNNK